MKDGTFFLYGLFLGGRCIYAGCTINPRRRESAHRMKHKSVTFSIFRTCSNDDPQRAAELEAQIIKAYRRRGECELNKITFPRAKKINDELSGRTDLAKSTISMMRHRDRHNDRCNAYNRERTRKKISAAVSLVAEKVIGGNGRWSKARRAEILRLHARGKSIATICIWTRTPASAVLAIIAGSQELNQTQAAASRREAELMNV